MWKRSSNSITLSCCLPINRSNTSPRESEESHCHNITLATKWIQQLTAADARASFQQLLKAVQARPSTHRKNEKRWHSSLHLATLIHPPTELTTKLNKNVETGSKTKISVLIWCRVLKMMATTTTTTKKQKTLKTKKISQKLKSCLIESIGGRKGKERSFC